MFACCLQAVCKHFARSLQAVCTQFARSLQVANCEVSLFANKSSAVCSPCKLRSLAVCKLRRCLQICKLRTVGVCEQRTMFLFANTVAVCQLARSELSLFAKQFNKSGVCKLPSSQVYCFSSWSLHLRSVPLPMRAGSPTTPVASPRKRRQKQTPRRNLMAEGNNASDPDATEEYSVELVVTNVLLITGCQ